MMPLDQALIELLENRFGSGAQSGPAPQKKWDLRNKKGKHLRFQGRQEIRVDAVGNDHAEHALIEVWDTKDGALGLKSSLIISGEQLQQFLAALLKAEAVEADLALTPQEHRPAFPIVIDEVPGSMGAIKLVLDDYKTRIQVKVSHTIPGRRAGGGWLSIGVEDIQPIGALVFLVLKSIRSADGAQADSAEQDLSF